MLIHISEDVCVRPNLVVSVTMQRIPKKSVTVVTVSDSHTFVMESEEEQEKAYVEIVQHLNSGGSVAIYRGQSVLVRSGVRGTYRLRYALEDVPAEMSSRES